MWQIMVFFLGAIAIAGSSLRYFSNPRSSGFLRFLASLALWAVFVISLPWWARDVLSPRQIVSWIVLAGSLALAISALSLLFAAKVRGAPTGPPPSGRAPELVTGGPYRYIRHPFYASLILAAWGMALKSGSWFAFICALLATALLYLAARAEEEENFDRFGAAYENYLSTTRMFVPGLF